MVQTSKHQRKEVKKVSKTNKTVVRNAAYRRSEINVRERHNERKNESYYNDDIIKERFDFNVHFKKCLSFPAGKAWTYEHEFNRMVDTGEISLRGLQVDAKVFDELIFDVNSDYFEKKGGYEYAKEFFQAAYNLAIQEVGGEQYILSAVMHADERNKALSEQYGRDVYHYHLHVIYIPIVEKQIFFRKNNKNPELAGKLKEVIKQVSHSKKWPRCRDENSRWINSYSLLQDRFFEHMKAAGFTDFERGERGSTAEHLSVIEFKTKAENERLAELTLISGEKEQKIAMLDEGVDEREQDVIKLDEISGKKKKFIERQNERIIENKKAITTIEQIDNMGKPVTFGTGINVTFEEMNTLKTLAKRSITDRRNVTNMKKERDKAVAELSEVMKKLPSLKDNLNFGKFLSALKRAPKRLMQVIEDILRNPPEQSGLETDLNINKRKSFDIPR
jgi:hypothetical protein